MTKKIIHTWNENGSVGVKYEEDGSLKRILLRPKWYFAILKSDVDRVRDLLYPQVVSFIEDLRCPEYLRVYPDGLYLSRSDLVQTLEKAGIPTFEGDLLPDRRWYIDAGIVISDTIKKLWFDIETDDTIQKIEVGRDRILSFSAVNGKGKIYFERLENLTDEAEIVLLKKILTIIQRYDLLIGWNSSQFDVPYLKLRMQKYGINRSKLYCWKELGHVDVLKRFRHIFRFDSEIKTFSLDNVSKHFLDRGKIPRTERVIDLWKNNPKKLEEYNIEDSKLVQALDAKLGVTDMMIRQSGWCGVPVGHFGLYSILDAYILRKAHSIGEFGRTSLRTLLERNPGHFRMSENPDETKTRKAKYLGALVLEPKVGKYKNVYSFDFKGLYPSLIRTSNIGYDSLRLEAKTENLINPGTLEIDRMTKERKPTYFDRKTSIINLAISDLIHLRSEYKEKKLQFIEEGKNSGPEWERIVSDEIIVKELANSVYGIMGLEYGRYFSVDVAESITLFGQWCLLFAKGFFEEMGFPVILGDTDSVFIATEEKLDTEAILTKFHIALKEKLRTKYNINESYIQLDFDRRYKSFLLLAKKTYVGNVINIEGKKTDGVYARGLDYIKKNTFKYAARKQKELVKKIFYDAEFDPHAWLQTVREDFLGRDFSPEDLTISTRISRDLKTYKTLPIHIRLAKELQERTGENLIHREIEYIITDRTMSLNGVLTSQFDGRYDKEYYWNNKTVPPLERILTVAYPGVDFAGLQLYEKTIKPRTRKRLEDKTKELTGV